MLGPLHSGEIPKTDPLDQRLQESLDAVRRVYREAHEARVSELLAANNALVERARKAEAEVERLRGQMLSDYREGRAADPTRWRHKARGSTYHTVGLARAQCPPDAPINDDEMVLVYRDIDTGKLAVRRSAEVHVRRSAEFHDGRFERVVDEGGSQ